MKKLYSQKIKILKKKKTLKTTLKKDKKQNNTKKNKIINNKKKPENIKTNSLQLSSDKTNENNFIKNNNTSENTENTNINDIVKFFRRRCLWHEDSKILKENNNNLENLMKMHG